MKKFLLLLIANCFCYTIFAQSIPAWSWINHYGSTQSDEAIGIKTDNDGNVYTLNYFNDSIEFGNQTFSNVYNTDYAVTKHDRNGNLIFTKRIHAPRFYGIYTPSVSAVSIAIDKHQNVFVAGNFIDSMNADGIGAHTSPQDQNAFLIKYNSNGTIAWLKNIGDASYDLLEDMTVDTAGNLIIKCTFNAYSKTYDNTHITVLTTEDNLMLGKINTSGTFVWINCPLLGNTRNSRLAVDNDNNFYVAGTYETGISFDGQTYINTHASDLLLMKFNSSGNFLWSNTPDSSGYVTLTGMAVDQNNNILLAGNVSTYIVFNAQDSFITNINPFDYCDFIAQYNTYGNNIWGKMYTCETPMTPISLTTDINNNFYVAGGFAGAWMNGADTVVSFGTYTLGAAVVKFNNTGTPQWVKYTEGEEQDFSGVAVDNTGNVDICGYYALVDNYPYQIGDSSLTSYMNSIYAEILIAHLSAQEMVTPGTQDKNAYCAGDSLKISFTNVDSAFNNGNTFTLQMSDSGGSFIYPTTLGTLSNASASGVFSVVLPVTTTPGIHYRLRIASSTPQYISWAYDTAFAVYALPPHPAITNTNGETLSCNTTGYSYQWYNNDTLIPGANMQTYTPTQSGTFSVTITNAHGCSATSSPFAFTTAISKISGVQSIDVYPNPVTDGVIRIQHCSSVNSFAIYDITGRCIQTWPANKNETQILLLNTSKYANGVYFLKVTSATDDVSYKKLLIQQ